MQAQAKQKPSCGMRNANPVLVDFACHHYPSQPQCADSLLSFCIHCTLSLCKMPVLSCGGALHNSIDKASYFKQCQGWQRVTHG
jgi:hypothetical protein